MKPGSPVRIYEVIQEVVDRQKNVLQTGFSMKCYYQVLVVTSQQHLLKGEKRDWGSSGDTSHTKGPGSNLECHYGYAPPSETRVWLTGVPEVCTLKVKSEGETVKQGWRRINYKITA